MQLFCNFSFVLFFQKGRALARISLFERSEEFFPTKPEFWRNLLFDLLLFLMVEKALVFVCIDI